MRISQYIDSGQISSFEVGSVHFSGVLDPEELFQTLKFGNTGNSLDLLGNEEQKVVPFESLEAERTDGICKSNLRKSLAWDSAFFTSAGRFCGQETIV